MAPVTSVRSIRLQNDLWARLAAEAERKGVALNGLVSDMLEGALSPKKSPTVSAGGGGSVRAGETVLIDYRSRPTTASVPVLQRKAFNPQPKGGKK